MGDREGFAAALGGTLAGSVLGGVMFMVGFVQLGIGQLFYCIRDIAQNSFYLRRL